MPESSAHAPRAVITEPWRVPVAGHDGHLPALPPQALTEPALRRCLAHAHRQTAVLPGDAGPAEWAAGGRAPADAAVLVALVAHAEGWRVLLTRRTAHLRDHAGQISFPGGRTEPEDAGPEATALREAQEEVGLAPERVEVIGRLPPYRTITRFVVTPVVGLVRTLGPLRPDPFEVEEVFEVPLDFLMAPVHHRRHHFERDGQARQFLSMPWPQDGEAPGRYFIWGATAAMLRNLYHCLAQPPQGG